MERSIKQYWEKFWESREDPGSQNDKIFQKLSHERIYDCMVPCDNLLVIGCGDGDGIELYQKRAINVTGIDFSEDAIHKARSKFVKHTFIVSDILTTNLPDGSFDSVISERCITNLDTISMQLKAFEEIYRILKPGGVFYMCEPTLNGYDAVDKLRELVGLSKIKRHWHNLLIDENNGFGKLTLISKQNFGLYTLISRIIYPLYVYPEEPAFDSKMNEVAYKISNTMFSYGYEIPSQHTLYTFMKDE